VGTMTPDPYHPAPFLDARNALMREVLGPSGARVSHVRVRQVTYRPRRSTTVMYEAHLHTSGARRGTHQLVVHTGRRGPCGLDPVAVDHSGTPVWMFRAAADPALPGLRQALDPLLMATLLDDLGMGRPGERVHLRLRAHRALRRAVVEVNGERGRLFLKVLPPAAAEALHRRHRLLAAAGFPVAPSVGWTTDGIVVIGAVPGRTLRAALDQGGPVPTPSVLHGVLDELPASALELPGPTPAAGRLEEFTEVLAAVHPQCAPELRGLTERITDVVGSTAVVDDVEPVHGDFYEAQVLVDDRGVTGLIDVDGVGRGRRVEDYANMLGHLSVYDLVAPHRRAAELGRRWLRQLDDAGRHHPAELRARIAAVAIGLATGPFRVQEPDWQRRTDDRLALARAWVVSAERARRSTLAA
jgi:hypothetical protein